MRKSKKLCLCDEFELLSSYISAGNKKHLDKHEVSTRMFKCEELLPLCHLAININTALAKNSRGFIEAVAIGLLLYLSTVLNFTG